MEVYGGGGYITHNDSPGTFYPSGRACHVTTPPASFTTPGPTRSLLPTIRTTKVSYTTATTAPALYAELEQHAMSLAPLAEQEPSCTTCRLHPTGSS